MKLIFIFCLYFMVVSVAFANYERRNFHISRTNIGRMTEAAVSIHSSAVNMIRLAAPPIHNSWLERHERNPAEVEALNAAYDLEVKSSALVSTFLELVKFDRIDIWFGHNATFIYRNYLATRVAARHVHSHLAPLVAVASGITELDHQLHQTLASVSDIYDPWYEAQEALWSVGDYLQFALDQRPVPQQLVARWNEMAAHAEALRQYADTTNPEAQEFSRRAHVFFYEVDNLVIVIKSLVVDTNHQNHLIEVIAGLQSRVKQAAEDVSLY